MKSKLPSSQPVGKIDKTDAEIVKLLRSKSKNREINFITRAALIFLIHESFLLCRQGWSVRKTAKILKILPSTVSEDLRIFKMLLLFPNLLSKIRIRRDALTELNKVRKIIG